uniref:Uncharacterized protein n=2 Tax=Brassica oleracea TaxID=3712 RepID=A0A0D3CAN4_BRAOL
AALVQGFVFAVTCERMCCEPFDIFSDNKKMKKGVGLRLEEDDEVGFYLVFLWFSFFTK